MGASSAHYDALIIGGGHNGLVCAAYLAAAGLKVVVLERRHVVGGAAVTEEFHPGFRNSVASYTVSLLNPKVIRDLELAKHGLRVVERRLANFLPTEDGRYLATGGATGAGKTKVEVAKFSARDAERLDEYSAQLDAIADLLRDLVLQTPPNVVEGSWRAALPELFRAAGLGGKLRKLSMPLRRELLALFSASAGDYLDGWFESAPIKALFGFDGIVGNYASPYTPGSAYVLLHHVFGEVNGNKGVWGHAVGGMGAITTAMATEARRLGVTLETDAPVKRIVTEGMRANAVELEDGRVIQAKVVAANVGPKLLYLKMLADSALPAELRGRIERLRVGSATFRMNVALSELPKFTAAPRDDGGAHLGSGIILAPSLEYMDHAFADARLEGMSRKPIVEILIPSTLDTTL